MSLSTFSIFYFNFSVTDDTKFISFSEGGPELTAELEVGDWTANELASKIKLALDTAGANVYTVVFDRDARGYEISTTVNFELLVATGTSGASAFPLLGFTGSDRTGAGVYQSNLGSGETYEPQFIIQDHIPSTNYQKLVSPAVNKTAVGRVEVVRFGTEKFIQMNFKLITNYPQDGKLIKNNPNGVADLQRFMQFAMTKRVFEYMPNINDRSIYESVILESAPGSSDGTGYQLKELYERGLPGFFETGILLFRVVEI